MPVCLGKEHLKSIFSKINKAIGLLRKHHHVLPRSLLLTIYNSFTRLHLDNGDIIYDQTYNSAFRKKLESIQYNAALDTAGALRGTSKGKLGAIQKARFGNPCKRRWYFLKIFRYQCAKHLFNIIPISVSTYSTRNTNNIPLFF